MQKKYKEETAEPCPNTILNRKGTTIISDETDEERSGVSYPPYMADSKRKRPEYKEIVITYLRD